MIDPEGVESREPRVDTDVVGRRLAAYLVDAVVLGGIALVVPGGGSRLRRVAGVAGVGGLLYHVLLEGTWGRTVGKATLGIDVVGDDDATCSYRAAAIRNALRPVDWLPAGYLLGLAAIGLTGDRQRVGDLVAGTRVARTGGPAVADRERERHAATGRAPTS